MFVDKERKRPQFHDDTVLQMGQGSGTKNKNFDTDFDEILSKTKQTGWNESTETKVLDARRRGRALTVKDPRIL